MCQSVPTETVGHHLPTQMLFLPENLLGYILPHKLHAAHPIVPLLNIIHSIDPSTKISSDCKNFNPLQEMHSKEFLNSFLSQWYIFQIFFAFFGHFLHSLFPLFMHFPLCFPSLLLCLSQQIWPISISNLILVILSLRTDFTFFLFSLPLFSDHTLEDKTNEVIMIRAH